MIGWTSSIVRMTVVRSSSFQERMVRMISLMIRLVVELPALRRLRMIASGDVVIQFDGRNVSHRTFRVVVSQR